MPAVMKLAIAVAALTAAMCFDVPVSHAYGDAPWCAVVSLGAGEVVWDCQYRTVEACVPNVIAGNRGFCNPNPAWSHRHPPGPAAPPHYRKRYRDQY